MIRTYGVEPGATVTAKEEADLRELLALAPESFDQVDVIADVLVGEDGPIPIIKVSTFKDGLYSRMALDRYGFVPDMRTFADSLYAKIARMLSREAQRSPS